VTDALNVGDSWRAMIEAFGEELDVVDPGATAVVALDWGLLTFRVRASARALRAPVVELKREYERRAAGTCESCGARGRVRGGPVVTIQCDECFNASR
jgi:hypothetical protein